MRIRTFLSLLAVVFFGILAGASFDEDGGLSGWVWFIIAAIIVVFAVALVSGNEEERKRREKEKAESEARKQRQAKA